MAEKPETTKRNKLWAGQISNASPHMLPLGAAVSQVNARCQVEGELSVRPGTQLVTFDNAIADAAGEVIAMYSLPGEVNDVLLYELSDGSVKAGRSPALP